MKMTKKNINCEKVWAQSISKTQLKKSSIESGSITDDRTPKTEHLNKNDGPAEQPLARFQQPALSIQK